MARDKIKDSTYFQEFIQRDEKRINNFLNKISSGEISEAKTPTIKRHIFSLSLDLVNARYSSGEQIPEIKKAVIKALDYAK